MFPAAGKLISLRMSDLDEPADAAQPPSLDQRIDALVRAAERATVIQCIACGAPATINDHGGWYLALCDRHAHQRRTVQMTSWKFLQEVALFPTEEL
jgi:hypothetical protein